MRLALLLLLSGCAVINPNYFRNMSTAQICHGLMAYPVYNVNHGARWAELERRGASCGSSAEIADAQRRSMDSFNSAIVPLVNTPPPPRPVVCTTNGNVTTCN